jgi:hypothetical protein
MTRIVSNKSLENLSKVPTCQLSTESIVDRVLDSVRQAQFGRTKRSKYEISFQMTKHTKVFLF